MSLTSTMVVSMMAIKKPPSFCNELAILILVTFTMAIKMPPSFYNELAILILGHPHWRSRCLRYFVMNW